MSETETSNTSSSSIPLNIGIIGFGPFAQFLAKTMIKQGHFLFATSRSDHSQLCSQLGVQFYKDMNPFFYSNNYDVILISTSILSFSQVLSSIPFHLLRKPTLFVDVLSVKEYPRQLLLQVLPEEADVLCTHPMFGPESGKNGWEGLAFMYEKVQIRDEDICSRFLQIFRSEGCRMVEMPCEEHDKQAARSQFLTHTIGRVLAQMDIKSTSMDTKGFETLVYLKNDVIKNSFDLYSGLFVHNRFAEQELKNLELALETVKQNLLNKMDETT
ncbi:Arogenate dehydrogenase 1 protein [Thalictrum thalictroides]|uniref:Arogenate dehydrogenase 1 protein n=1 Tax=Thalictrum thalictroides TaxID=46969 RepID=A0A7J6VLA8_THATH|nr:Arogenate dehydrogenase 1 protein [Thalictrum thalictroides]